MRLGVPLPVPPVTRRARSGPIPRPVGPPPAGSGCALVRWAPRYRMISAPARPRGATSRARRTRPDGTLEPVIVSKRATPRESQVQVQVPCTGTYEIHPRFGYFVRMYRTVRYRMAVSNSNSCTFLFHLFYYFFPSRSKKN